VGARLPADGASPRAASVGSRAHSLSLCLRDDRVVLVDPAEREVVHVLEW
jgi:hypothetical protein